MRLKLLTTVFVWLCCFTWLYSQPLPITPNDGDTGIALSTDISWTDFADVAGPTDDGPYTLNIYSDAGYSTLLGSIASIPAGGGTTTVSNADITTAISAALIYNATYYWEVLDENEPITVYQYSFTTEIATPLQTGPTDAATGISLDPTLTWSMDASTTDIVYYVDYDEDGSVGGWDNTVGPFAAATTDLAGLSNNTTYHWQVRAEVDNVAAPNDNETTTSAAEFTFTTIPIAPTLSSPGDTDTNVLLTDNLVWNTVAGGDAYYLEVDDDPAFGSPLYSGDRGNTTTYNPGMDYNTTYYWHVRASNDGGSTWGEYSTDWEFDTEIDAPTLNSPLATFDESLTPTLDWDYDIGGDANPITLYVEYKKSTAGGWTEATSGAAVTGAGQTYTFGGDLDYNTDYDWRIRVENDNDAFDTKNDASTFKTLLPTPTLDQYIGGADVYDRTPTLTWSIDASTTTTDVVYDVWLDGAEVSSDQAGTSYTPGANLDLGNHEWYVVIQDNNGGAGENSDQTSVTEDFDVLPSLTFPYNGVTGVPILPELKWEDGLVDEYTIQIRTAAQTFGVNSIDITVDDTEFTDEGDIISYILNSYDEANLPLAKNTLYYWRVLYSEGGNDYVSQEWHFTTVPNVTITHTFPNNGGLVYDTDVTLYWYTSVLTGTNSYQVQFVRDEVTGGTPDETEWYTVATTQDAADINKEITVLAGKKYWWRVVMLNSDDLVISYSTPWSFTVIGGISITITQSWPVGNPTVYTTTPTCYWYANQYPLGTSFTVWYKVGGDTDANGWINAADGAASVVAGSDIYAQLLPLTEGATYSWSVEANYNGEQSYSGIQTFTVYNTAPLVVPIATYPIGGVTIYTTAPYIYYYTATDVSGLYFDIEYDLVGNALTGAADLTTLSTGLLSIQVPGLTPGETYHYKLRSNNGAGGTSGWSSEYTFTVTGGIVYSYPVQTWPVGNPTVYTLNPTLYWYLEGSTLGITGYEVKYTNDPAASGWNSATWEAFSPGAPGDDDGEMSIGNVSTTFWEITADLNYGDTYYWAVSSVDAGGESDYDVSSFTVFGVDGAVAPTLTSPSNTSTIGTRSPTLYWYINGSTVGFQSYTLVYSYSDVFAAGATTTVPGLTNSYKALSGLQPGATYYWYVTAVYDQGTATSATFSFTVDPGSSSVQPLVGGPNNVTVSTVSPTFSWVLPAISGSSLTFELQVADNQDFLNAVTYSGLTEPQQVVNDLQDGTQYYWRVRSSTVAGNISYYSNTGSFKVVGSNITDTEESQIVPTDFAVMQNYPNPFNPTTTINYSLPEASFVSIKVYDMLGREVKTLVNTELTTGIHSINWNGDDNFGYKVSSGTYIYRVIAGHNVVTKKMVLLK